MKYIETGNSLTSHIENGQGNFFLFSLASYVPHLYTGCDLAGEEGGIPLTHLHPAGLHVPTAAI